MHNRNIFKDSPPDFRQLMLEYPEFAPYVQIGVSGKAYVNFKDPASLRSLSVVLLKKFFNISIDIPLDRLIPTIPLRLNYIHWIEDLSGCLNKSASGIDIGCGASCIYPLLGNKMNNWKFIATEVNVESHAYAVKNVLKNCAEDSVKVILTSPEKSVFDCVIASEFSFDFTLCNPPFFPEVNDDIIYENNRTGHRPPPISQSTASDSESFTKGGEVEFVKRMMDESLLLKEKIRWYTTMLGKKSSLKELISYAKFVQIPKLTTTEFRQGRTMRWGLGWTFNESIPNVLTTVKKKPTEKKPKPFYLILSDQFYQDNNLTPVKSSTPPKNVLSTMWLVMKVIKHQLQELQIVLEEPEYITHRNQDAYEINGKAFQNTWTHTRQKRRKLSLANHEEAASKKNKVDGESDSKFSITKTEGSCNFLSTPSVLSVFKNDAQQTDNSNTKLREHVGYTDKTSQKQPTSYFTCKNVECLIGVEEYLNKEDLSHDTKCSILNLANNFVKKERENEIDNPEKHFSKDLPHLTPLLSFSCTVGTSRQFQLAEKNSIVLSFLCVEGNREQFHQMFLYLKNILKGSQIKK